MRLPTWNFPYRFPLVCLHSLVCPDKVLPVQYVREHVRLCTVPFLPYPVERAVRSRISFVFRTILLRAAIVSGVFCTHCSFLLSGSYLGTPVDSVLHLPATMTSADFCALSGALRHRLLLSGLPAQTSPGTTRFFPSICLPHLSRTVPCSYRASACIAVLPRCGTLYVVSVRQAGGLPAGVGPRHPASFRFHLTMDTLAFGCILPTTGRISDFHRLETCAAGRTTKNVRHRSAGTFL